MLKELFKFILDQNKPEQIVVDDKTYYDPTYVCASKKTKYPDTIGINTLSGIVDYIKSSPEKWEDLMLHVENFNLVHLYQCKSGDFNQRHCILTSGSNDNGFDFGRFMGFEDFKIALNSVFMENTDRNYTLKFIAAVKIDANSTIKDDGITQKVTARQGASSLVSGMDIKPIVELIPYRTFPEIEQPPSNFLFRLKFNGADNAPTCALFESDGGAWQHRAITNIRDFLSDAVPGVSVIA